MELVEGDTLADRIATGRLPVDEALNIAKQICNRRRHHLAGRPDVVQLQPRVRRVPRSGLR